MAMDHVTDELARAEVLDVDGKPHRLDEFWRARPALILFVRHFG
jgi:hypothetical protein